MKHSLAVLSILVFFVACATEKTTKVEYNTCFDGAGRTWAVYENGVSDTFNSDFELTLKIDNTFEAAETHRHIVPRESAVVYRYNGMWQPLENGSILLIEDGKKDYYPIFRTAYDSITAKGIRRIDARRYVLNVDLDSVSLGRGLWLHRHPCDNVIRLRRR